MLCCTCGGCKKYIGNGESFQPDSSAEARSFFFSRKPGDPSGPERGPRYDRSAALQKMTAAAVLTAVARMPAPTMEAGAALPYWLR